MAKPDLNWHSLLKVFIFPTCSQYSYVLLQEYNVFHYGVLPQVPLGVLSNMETMIILTLWSPLAFEFWNASVPKDLDKGERINIEGMGDREGRSRREEVATYEC
jgi:hypothetical protein